MTRRNAFKPLARSEYRMAQMVSSKSNQVSGSTHGLSRTSNRLPTDVSANSALTWAVELMAAAGVDTPRLDAELLLCEALGWRRARLYAYPEHPLSRIERSMFRHLAKRRLDREPLAYLLGRKEFFGLDLQVDRRVLVPRPETEVLVELALSWLEATPPPEAGFKVADVGTGSGAVAIALARHATAIRVYALDLSEKALEVAQANCNHHGVSARVELLRGDLLAPLRDRVDLIVANLPYVSLAELETLPPEISTYEPRVALDGGPDGLDLVRRLLGQAAEHLRHRGAILLEIAATHGPTALALAARFFPGARIDLHRDLAGRDRVLEIHTGGTIGKVTS